MCVSGSRQCVCQVVDHVCVKSACLVRVMQGGATLYALRIPEKIHPGKFDMWLNSHQLFHLCIVVAAAIHYKAVMQLLAWRDACGGCMDVNSAILG